MDSGNNATELLEDIRSLKADNERLRSERDGHLLVCERLRGELSLAEEGLANYQQELEQIKRTREQERDYADVCYENERLRQRCWAMAYLLYPVEPRPREAVAGDFGLHPTGDPEAAK